MRNILVVICGLFVIIGCEKDNHHDHYDNGYYRDSNYDNNNYHPQSSYQSNGQNYQQPNYNNQYSYQQPQQNPQSGPVNGQNEAFITVNNQSSVPITFSVNGDGRTVVAGQSSTWSYRGTAQLISSISGNTWSQFWSDGLNHTYIAHDNGIPGSFNFN